MTRTVLIVGLLALAAGCSSSDIAEQVSDPVVSAGSTAPDAGSPSKELLSVQADVGRLAPALESALRGTTYPTDLPGALTALQQSVLSTSVGNTVAGYVYDPADTEFTLCVESASGAFATYDTAPMSLRQEGESGGCPDA